MLFTSQGAAKVDADPSRLSACVALLSKSREARYERNVKRLDEVAAYIHGGFAAVGGRVADQPFDVKGREYRNVIASFGQESDDRIVIGAHYDGRRASRC
jgi:hypothetical protein